MYVLIWTQDYKIVARCVCAYDVTLYQVLLLSIDLPKIVAHHHLDRNWILKMAKATAATASMKTYENNGLKQRTPKERKNGHISLVIYVMHAFEKGKKINIADNDVNWFNFFPSFSFYSLSFSFSIFSLATDSSVKYFSLAKRSKLKTWIDIKNPNIYIRRIIWTGHVLVSASLLSEIIRIKYHERKSEIKEEEKKTVWFPL